jgi:hypothetical protein
MEQELLKRGFIFYDSGEYLMQSKDEKADVTRIIKKRFYLLRQRRVSHAV